MKKLVLLLSVFSSMTTVYPADHDDNPFNPDIEALWDKKHQEHSELFAPQPEIEEKFVDYPVFAAVKSHHSFYYFNGHSETTTSYAFYLTFGGKYSYTDTEKVKPSPHAFCGWFPHEEKNVERFEQFNGFTRYFFDYYSANHVDRYNESSDEPSHPNDTYHTKTLFSILAQIRKKLIESGQIPAELEREKDPCRYKLHYIEEPIGTIRVPEEVALTLNDKEVHSFSTEKKVARKKLEELFIEQYFDTALKNPYLGDDLLRRIPPLCNLGAEDPPLTREEAALIRAKLQREGLAMALHPDIRGTIDYCADRPVWADNPGIMFDKRPYLNDILQQESTIRNRIQTDEISAINGIKALERATRQRKRDILESNETYFRTRIEADAHSQHPCTQFENNSSREKMARQEAAFLARARVHIQQKRISRAKITKKNELPFEFLTSRSVIAGFQRFNLAYNPDVVDQKILKQMFNSVIKGNNYRHL